MELKIIKERDTPLLSRKRATLEVVFKGATPTRAEIREAIAAKLKADKELTVVKHIYTRYGVEKAKVIAHIYSSKDDMKRFEEKGTLKKHEKKEEAEKEEAGAKKEESDAKAEEKPGDAGEVEKEEAKAEEKGKEKQDSEEDKEEKDKEEGKQ